jgi:cyclopropane fatty-acyl-phospholipid synthase-like methyltransferase
VSRSGPSQDTAAVGRYFAAEADRFDSIYAGTNRAPLQAAVDALFRTRMLRLRNRAVAGLVDEGADCFELGCGSGRTAIELARCRGVRVHGIDLAGPMVQLARRNASAAGVEERCDFELAEFDSLSPARRYETFVAVGVLDYFADPLPMLRRAAREFVPGGAIVLSWPVRRMALNAARRSWLATRRCPVHFYGEDDIEQLAQEIGGRVTRAVTTGTPPLTRDGVARIEL